MYTLKERLIYRYHDGQRQRAGDPMAIEDAYLLAMAHEDQDAIRQQLASPIQEIRLHALDRMVPAIRQAFGIAPGNLATDETHRKLQDLQGWKERVRIKYRRLAQYVALYGHDPARPLDYEAHCGLLFNSERVSAFQAVQVARGIVSAIGGKTHPSLIAAMAESETKVGWMQLQVECERIEAEAASQISQQGSR